MGLFVVNRFHACSIPEKSRISKSKGEQKGFLENKEVDISPSEEIIIKGLRRLFFDFFACFSNFDEARLGVIKLFFWKVGFCSRIKCFRVNVYFLRTRMFVYKKY